MRYIKDFIKLFEQYNNIKNSKWGKDSYLKIGKNDILKLCNFELKNLKDKNAIIVKNFICNVSKVVYKINNIKPAILKHKKKKIRLGNKRIECDKKLINLILELNKIGLITDNCCKGDLLNKAYISFDNKKINNFKIENKKDNLIIRWMN